MKKRILSAFLALCAALGCCAAAGCTGENGGEQTTASETTEAVLQEETEKMVEIISPEMKMEYQIVRADVCTSEVTAAVSKLVNFLRKDLEISVEVTTDWKRNPQRKDKEILIGQTGDEADFGFDVDRELLGDGFMIRSLGDKILVTGGTDRGTAAAVDWLVSSIPASGGFGLPENFEYTSAPGAPLENITVGGIPIAEFTVEYPGEDPVCVSAAAELRRRVFSGASALLREGSGAHKIVLSTEGGADDTVFEVSVSGGVMTIKGKPRIGLCRCIRDMFEECMPGSGVWALGEGEVYRKDYGEFVTYEDYGAKGDGTTDDAEAIRTAHDAANKKNVPVLAREDAEYMIGGKACTATVMTDTDWSTARFVIDDRKVEKISTEIFKVMYSSGNVNLSVKSLKAGQENIGVKLPGRCAVTVTDSSTKQYIRTGSNQDSGSSMTDVFMVDENGNVDASTPILWDYSKISSITARPTEAKQLTLKGGVFTTIANADKSEYHYYYRGIRIYRSNVLVDGLKHYVTGEGSQGAPYYGILIFNGSADSEIRNVTLTAHKTYKTIGSAGSSVSMGTYDITVTNCMNFKAVNCRQTTDINDSAYWGVFASNYSKNIVFENCSFSRFDAHKGVCNVTLKGCSLGHQGINLIGHGTALIEDCTIYGSALVNLRSDYGSTWAGDLIIRNCTYIPKNGAKCDAILISGSNDGAHDYGYTCYLPQNIVIDGLDIRDTNTTKPPMIFADISKSRTSDGYKAPFPVVVTKTIRISGVTTASGKELGISTNTYMFRDVQVERQ